MSILKTPLEKAVGALEVCDRRLADFQSDRAAKVAQVDATSDFDAGFALREELAVIDRKIEAATVAREHAAGQVECTRAAEAVAEGDRRHAAAQKTARAGEKLTLDVIAAAEKLADALAALEANRAEVDAANEERGARPYIADGEFRVRGTPAREVPARTRREKAWIAADGSRPGRYRDDGTGRMIPADHRSYDFKEVEVVDSPARIEPPSMPPRLADSFEIVGLRGERLWPKR